VPDPLKFSGTCVLSCTAPEEMAAVVTVPRVTWVTTPGKFVVAALERRVACEVALEGGSLIGGACTLGEMAATAPDSGTWTMGETANATPDPGTRTTSSAVTAFLPVIDDIPS
jgi:hypothetical protein